VNKLFCVARGALVVVAVLTLTPLTAGAADSPPKASDVVATVGGLPVHEWEVVQAINSTPMQGYASQLHTTPTGVRVKQAFLEGLVNQRLLYLEAKAQGLDETEAFRAQMATWTVRALADLYTRDYFNRRSKITDAEIEAAWKEEKNTKRGANELDAQMRQVMRNKLAARRFAEVRKELREALGGTVKVEAKDATLSLKDDEKRDPEQVVATVAGEPITWRQARGRLLHKESVAERRVALRAMGVEILKARKARSLGLDQDPAYRHHHDDFVNDLIAAQLMTKLRKQYIPTDEQFAEYYKAHPKMFTVPERRRLQQIVVKTEKEAKALRAEILKKTTDDYDPFYKLAQERSLDPTAARTSGVLGWVTQGEGKIAPELERAAFSLKVKEVSEPVASPRGYHLIRTLEKVASVHLSLKQINGTDKRARYNELLLKKKLEPYLAGLRKRYKVVIDKEWFGRGPRTPDSHDLAQQHDTASPAGAATAASGAGAKE